MTDIADSSAEAGGTPGLRELVGESWPAMSNHDAIRALTAPGARFEMVTRTIDGQPRRVWKNGFDTIADLVRSAEAFSDRTCIVLEDERATYRGVLGAVQRLAAALMEAGVGHGTRVAVAMRNLPEWPVAYFACGIIGATCVPLNAWWQGGELGYAILDSGARVLIADEERWDRIRSDTAAYDALDTIIVTRSESRGDGRVRMLEDIIGTVATWDSVEAARLPDVVLSPDQAMTLFYTSGTTGRPKGVEMTHRGVLHNLMAAEFSAARTLLRRVVDTLPALPRAQLLPVPLFHITGAFNILGPNFAAGGKLVLMKKWDAQTALSLIERERITHVSGVPTIAIQLIEHAARSAHDLSTLRVVGYGGAPAPRDLPMRIARAFPGAWPSFGSGMTEAGLVTQCLGEDYLFRPTSAGPVMPVFDVEIRDEEDRPLPLGTPGELLLRGFCVSTRYWGQADAPNEGGWLRTGDVALIDDEGFLHIVDRSKDVIIRGGENIYCAEVESHLHEYPGIIDAALVGRHHPVLGEEPCAFVVLSGDSTGDADALRAWLLERIAPFKVPVTIIFEPDMLPRNASGKILKAILRDRLAEAKREN